MESNYTIDLSDWKITCNPRRYQNSDVRWFKLRITHTACGYSSYREVQYSLVWEDQTNIYWNKCLHCEQRFPVREIKTWLSMVQIANTGN